MSAVQSPNRAPTMKSSSRRPSSNKVMKGCGEVVLQDKVVEPKKRYMRENAEGGFENYKKRARKDKNKPFERKVMIELMM